MMYIYIYIYIFIYTLPVLWMKAELPFSARETRVPKEKVRNSKHGKNSIAGEGM